jgi:hypothetical protein
MTSYQTTTMGPVPDRGLIPPGDFFGLEPEELERNRPHGSVEHVQQRDVDVIEPVKGFGGYRLLVDVLQSAAGDNAPPAVVTPVGHDRDGPVGRVLFSLSRPATSRK